MVCCVTMLTRAKAYCLGPLLDALAALESEALRYLVVVGGELAPEQEALLAAWRPEGREVTVRRVPEPPPSPNVAHRVAALRQAAWEGFREAEDAEVLWVDADVLVPPETLTRLREHGQPVVSALVTYRGTKAPITFPAWEGTEPAFREAVGFSCLLVRGDVARGTGWGPYLKRPPAGVGEDVWWCQKAADGVLVDPEVRPWHVGEKGIGGRARLGAAGRWDREVKILFEVPRTVSGRRALISLQEGNSHNFGRLRRDALVTQWSDGRAISDEEMVEIAESSQFFDLIDLPAAG